MPAIITDRFRIHNSEQFHEAFSEASGNTMYLGIGRPQAFAVSTRGDARTNNEGSDISPLTPADNLNAQHFPFDDMLASKKIPTTDVTFAIPRRNWVTGTTYDTYRHDYGEYATGGTTAITSNSGASTLFDATFYVLTTARNVYKCLDNNGGATSTVEPTGTSTNILVLGDGYKWKYMYTLTAAQQSNFLSTDFMAVATDATISSAAVDGAINIIKIKSVGTGGTDGTHTSVPIRGDGSGGTCTVTIASGIVSAVTVTAAGTGYTFATIRVADINTAGGGALVDAELDCIIEPKGGHGFNAIKEMGGFFVMVNVNLEGAETGSSGDFTTANDFRKILLVRDPFSGGSAATGTTLRGVKVVRFAASPTPGNFQVDEEINQSSTGAVGKVVEWDSTNRLLYYMQTRFNDEGADSNGNGTALSGANVITGTTSSATGTPGTASETVDSVVLTGGYAAAEIDADTGDVIYIEQRVPITRASDQTENIKLIIEF